MTLWPLPTGVKFLIVAAVCALAHNVIMIALDAMGVHYAASNVVSYVVCVSIGFVLHAGWTYRQTLTWQAFARYATPMLANYPASVALMFLAIDIAHLPMIIAAPVTTLCMFIWNFATTRWALRIDRPATPSPN